VTSSHRTSRLAGSEATSSHPSPKRAPTPSAANLRPGSESRTQVGRPRVLVRGNC
jgi:hypothetical protein